MYTALEYVVARLSCILFKHMFPACDYGDDGHLVSVAVVSRVVGVLIASVCTCSLIVRQVGWRIVVVCHVVARYR